LCSQQCMYAYNKTNKVVGMTRRTIKNKEPKIMVNLYKTLVMPPVQYYSSAKELIEKIQHRFTKMIMNMESKSYDERIQYLGL